MVGQNDSQRKRRNPAHTTAPCLTPSYLAD